MSKRHTTPHTDSPGHIVRHTSSGLPGGISHNFAGTLRAAVVAGFVNPPVFEDPSISLYPESWSVLHSTVSPQSSQVMLNAMVTSVP